MDAVDVVVRNRDGTVFTGHVFAVSSVNEIGNFDILPQHANFICTVKDSLTIHHNKEKKQELKIDNGVLRAKANLIEVYIGI